MTTFFATKKRIEALEEDIADMRALLRRHNIAIRSISSSLGVTFTTGDDVSVCIEKTDTRLDDQGRIGYTPMEVSQMLPIGRDAAYALARQIGFRVGRRKLFISEAALKAWLSSGKVMP